LDDDHMDVGRLVKVIEDVEAAKGLADVRFPHDGRSIRLTSSRCAGTWSRSEPMSRD
jgi:hypothetical protein